MKEWTLIKAILALGENIDIIDKTIIVEDGFKGLSACGAYDYLKNVHKYTGRFYPKKKSKTRNQKFKEDKLMNIWGVSFCAFILIFCPLFLYIVDKTEIKPTAATVSKSRKGLHK